MIIDKVNYLNLDTLFDMVVDKSRNEYYKSLKFGSTYSDLLNHVVFSFHLRQVTMYEYFFLKKFSTSITEFFDRGIRDYFVKETYPELYENGCKSYLALVSNLNNEIEKDYMSFFSPSGFVSGSCVVTLSGTELRNFIGFDLDSFFKSASKGRCCKEDDSYDISYRDLIYGDEEFNNYIISSFLNGFYKFLLNSSLFKSNDILSDTYNYKKFITNISDNNIQLASIRNPVFNIDFINDDYDDVLSIFNSYKEHFDSTYTFNNTYLEINISSPFSTLFELFSILPKDKFISIESFGIPENNSHLSSDSSNYECPEELKGSYENRFYGRIDSLLKSISDTYSDNKFILKKLELITNNTLVKYTILVSFSDISYILNEYIESNSNSKDYIVDTTIYFINKIINLSKTIYNSLK